MTESNTVDSQSIDDRQRPSFSGCIFCYAGSWISYAGKRAYRVLVG